MKRTFAFRKMDGAGNDFLFLHDPAFPRNPDGIARLCGRKRGIGCDGLIVLSPEKEGIRFEYYNADGSRAEMCGNGLRCAMEYAFLEGLAGTGKTVFLTDSGPLSAERIGDGRIRISMPVPEPFRDVTCGNTILHVTRVGCPHAVVETEDLDHVPVDELGRKFRFAPELGKDGANIDFVQIGSADSLHIRTYERGVEGETLACGTGSVAAAAWLLHSRGGKREKRIFCRGGDVLGIEFPEKNCIVWGEHPRLSGPARCVFRGTFDMETD